MDIDRKLRLCGAWWHADDVDTAVDCLRDSLAAHGLEAALPEARLRAETEAAEVISDEDEALLRRHQLGIVAVHANLELARRGDERRFRSFGEPLQDESDEPAWILVTPAQHAEMLAFAGPPLAAEMPYDRARSVEELPSIVLQQPVPLSELHPTDAHRQANQAFRRGDFAEVIRLSPVAKRDGQHGLLAQLLHLEALQKLGRLDEARAELITLADEWLTASYTVWDTQWQKLAAFYTALALPTDERLAKLKARC